MPDVDFHTGIYGTISFIRQLPGYCFVYVGFYDMYRPII
jgi:hypothetical protein